MWAHVAAAAGDSAAARAAAARAATALANGFGTRHPLTAEAAALRDSLAEARTPVALEQVHNP